MDGQNRRDKECIWKNIGSKYCLKCIVRQLCCNWKTITSSDEEIIEYLHQHCQIDSDWIFYCEKVQNINNKEIDENCTSICQTCSNILSVAFVNHCVNLIKNCLQEKDYEFSSFQLLISMPLSLIVQEQATSYIFKEQLGHENVEEKPFSVKEVFKALLDPVIAECLNAERKINAELEILLTVINPQTDKVLLPQLKLAHPESFASSDKKYRFNKRQRVSDDKVTITQVKNATKNIESSELQRMTSSLDKVCNADVQFHHLPIYLGGRYNKYSRRLPQTPWIIDGERKIKNCVEEYLAQPMKVAFKASGYNFSSSGREDVDVRMLGDGRPFIVELLNPRTTTASHSSVKLLEDTINAQSPDVKVSRLQIVDKSECKRLKEGETEKTKSYSALCCFLHPPTRAHLDKMDKLNEMDNIELLQTTPVRVLHRRPLAIRTRKVYSIKTERSEEDSSLFRLQLVSQAGTYIKEFVHGDFGRTTPSLQDYLGAQIDIIELDVLGVNLDWPLLHVRPVSDKK